MGLKVTGDSDSQVTRYSLDLQCFQRPVCLVLQSVVLFGGSKIIEMRVTGVDGSFGSTWSHSSSVPKKHTEACMNYKRFGLLAQAYN